MTDLGYCRLCAEMKISSSLTVIKQNENDSNTNLYYKILQCFQIEILSDDHLPKTICLNCCTQTNITYEFFQKVQNAQELLHNIIFNTNGNNDDTRNEINSEESLKLDKNLTDSPINSKLLVKTEFLDNDSSQFSTQIECSDYIETSDNENECIKAKQMKTEENENKKSPRKRVRNKNWSCNKCSNKFKTRNHLVTHSQNVHGKSPEYKCSLCPKIYVNYKMLTQHMCVHKNQDKFRCNICNKTFNYKHSLKRHLGVYHEQDPNTKITCPICGKVFKGPESYDYHQKHVHTPAENRLKYECDICKKQLTCKTTLTVHKKIHDESSKDNICDQCGMGFRFKSILEDHIEKIHTKIDQDKYLSCSLCPTRFKVKAYLRKHMLTMHSDKRYECEKCGKKFSLRTPYTLHLQIHTGERPFECHYCNKRFRLKPDLKKHIRQHTGEKPYSCTDCKHDFTDFGNYVKHMRGKHGATEFKYAQTTNTQ